MTDFSLEYWPRRSPFPPPNTAADPYPGAIWNYRCTAIFSSWRTQSPMLARLGPASLTSKSCGRHTAVRFIHCTLYSHWNSTAVLAHYYRFHISPQPPVGLRVRGRKLEGRTSWYQAFACAIAWLLVPALLNLAHPNQPDCHCLSLAVFPPNTTWRSEVGLCPANGNKK